MYGKKMFTPQKSLNSLTQWTQLEINFEIRASSGMLTTPEAS